MKANEVKFRELLEGTRQYQVPLFQRIYVWKHPEWKQLWDDIAELYEERDATHFIGAVVTIPIPDAPERASKFTIIDGQQRLTTLLVLLSVLAHRAEKVGNEFLVGRVRQDFLENRTRHSDEKYKLTPTQGDRAAFEQIMTANPLSGDSRLHQVALFFNESIDEGYSCGEEYDLEKLSNTVTTQLEIVSITLDREDSPNRIFESLNNTGVGLSAADLIRNHIFMLLPGDRHKNVYDSMWIPMEEELGDPHLTNFFWRYLMMDGDRVRKDNIYTVMRDRIRKMEDDIDEFLDLLREHSQSYNKIVNPMCNELDSRVRIAMGRLNRWELDTAHPYLLKVYAARNQGHVTSDQCLDILRHLESFAVRRHVCGISAQSFGRIFSQVAAQFDQADPVGQLIRHLAGRNWPSDEDFQERFINFRAYVQSRRDRCHLILSSLEGSFEHREQAEIDRNVTIEHIMPREIGLEWKRN